MADVNDGAGNMEEGQIDPPQAAGGVPAGAIVISPAELNDRINDRVQAVLAAHQLEQGVHRLQLSGGASTIRMPEFKDGGDLDVFEAKANNVFRVKKVPSEERAALAANGLDEDASKKLWAYLKDPEGRNVADLSFDEFMKACR